MKFVPADYLSLTTNHLEIGFSLTEKVFSHATGFIYFFKNKYYLITNWHNVTGRNPIEKKRISQEHAGIPDYVKTFFRFENNSLNGQYAKIMLYEDQGLKVPKWLVHPIFREKVDVVAIQINPVNGLTMRPINHGDFDQNIHPIVGDECFVIGYPFSNKRFLGMPIWKKASIATEPILDEDQLPKILIDSATRPGLSGSPVIYQRIGIHHVYNGKFNNDSMFGRIRGFLGIYSGRIGKDEFQAQLGIVWKAKVIEEIIEGNVKDNIEFQNW